MKDQQEPVSGKKGGLTSSGTRSGSAPDSPLISVITVVYNGERHLEKSIVSVVQQSYKNFEYLIVDGNSTDGTLEIIRKYEDAIDYWVSEPDQGIFDAMNKALDAARGEWIYFLGADDKLHQPDTLAKIAPLLDKGFALVFGSICYPNGRIVRSSLGPRTLIRNCLHHQGAFYNALLFKEWRYDASLRIVADYELNLLVYLGGRKFKKVKEVVAFCGDEGVSLAFLKMAAAELNAVRKRHVGVLANIILSGLFRLEFEIYRLYKALKRKAAA